MSTGTPAGKRLLDIALSSVALLALAPVFLLAAVVVRMSSPGPVFYRARRAGYKGRPFHALKFRTMHVGSDRQGAITANSDPRVFPAGIVLRRLAVDELPQLLNVLKGEMSLVGPRPEDVDIVERCYTAEMRSVLDVAPGLTGLPQVRFYPEFPMPKEAGLDTDKYYCDVILPMRIEMDLDYVRRRSFWLDLRLILVTAYLVGCKSWKSALRHGTRPAALAGSESA